MKSLLQRVTSASVTVDDNVVGEIEKGILVFVGLEKGDTESDLDWHIQKLLALRIFPDEQGRMGKSVTDIAGELLIVSQFTLAGECKKGTKPSFDNAMPPDEARQFYELYLSKLKAATSLKVATGQFAAMMQVALVNDGPVTFII